VARRGSWRASRDSDALVEAASEFTPRFALGSNSPVGAGRPVLNPLREQRRQDEEEAAATTAANRLLWSQWPITQPNPSDATISGITMKKLKIPM